MTNAQTIARFIATRGFAQVRSGNGTLFSQEGTLYSYGRHYPLARFGSEPGRDCVLYINSDRYSVTTSKHRSGVVNGAIRSGVCCTMLHVDTNRLRNIHGEATGQRWL